MVPVATSFGMCCFAEEVAWLSAMVTNDAEDTIDDAVSGHSRNYAHAPL